MDRGRRFESAEEMLGELRRLKVEGNGAHGWAKAKMPRALWRPLSMAIGFLVVLTAIVATWRRDHTSERSAPPVSTASNQQSLKASAQPRQEYDRSAIAVLPFENLNKDHDNEAFASGLHHDLLTQISQISSLKVISRTSVMGYASGSARNIRQIAEELSVGTVLEGGVQRLGDRVRVNAQLIDARNDEHIWADTFDRELSVTNVFEIQSEIASQVARVLQTEIAWVALNDPLPTTNLEAYDFFVRGNEYYHRPGSQPEDRDNAIAMYRQAVEQDPMFALAWANLARSLVGARWDREGRYALEEHRMLALQAARRALEIDPALAEGHLALAGYHWRGEGADLERASESLRVAERGLPGDWEVLHLQQMILYKQGKFDEALKVSETAASLDPLNSEVFYWLGIFLRFAERHKEAIANFDRALQLAPDFEQAMYHRANAFLLGFGDTAPAREYFASIPERNTRSGGLPPFELSLLRWNVEVFDRNFDAALGVLGKLEKGAVLKVLQREVLIGLTHRLTSDDDAAARVLESLLPDLQEKLDRMPEDHLAHLNAAVALACLGRKMEAIRHGKKAEELSARNRQEREPHPDIVLWLARIYALLNEPASAAEKIDNALSVPSVASLRGLRKEPIFDTIRSHPAWQALEEKYLGGEI